jgi:Ca-activated chloride channel homolog
MNQFSFGYQTNLYLLLPLLVLIIWYWEKWKGRISVHKTMHTSNAQRNQTSRFMIARIAALSFIILAMSFPRFGYHFAKKEKKVEDIIVVLDFSYSMWAQDVSPSRMERAKREIIDLTEILQGSRVGLVGFAGGASARMPMTTDYKVLHKFLMDSSPMQFRSQGSNLVGGVELALDLCQKSSVRSKSILVISDGESHDQSLEEVANRAKKLGVRIYALAVGGDAGVPIPLPSGGFLEDINKNVVMTKRDDNSLYHLAKITKGAFAISTVGIEDISVLYKDGISRLSKERVQSNQEEKIWNEMFQWPLVISLLCLLYTLPFRRIALNRMFGLLILLSIPVVDAQEFDSSHTTDEERQAIVLLRSGHSAQAQEILQRLLGLQDSFEAIQRLEYNAGIAAYRSGKLLVAEKHWNTVLQRDERHQYARKNLTSVRKEIKERNAQDNRKTENNEEKKNTDKKSKKDIQKSKGIKDKSIADRKMEVDSSEAPPQIQHWTKDKARRLIDSVQEGTLREEYRGIGSQEKGW